LREPSNVELESKSESTPNNHLEQGLKMDRLTKLLKDKLVRLYVLHFSRRKKSIVSFIVYQLVLKRTLYDVVTRTILQQTATCIQF
jgi:hypothetical protein